MGREDYEVLLTSGYNHKNFRDRCIKDAVLLLRDAIHCQARMYRCMDKDEVSEVTIYDTRLDVSLTIQFKNHNDWEEG